ncbi:Receptor-type tyrosine-protein phosphatase T [Holothuria leucospilota]|uniref:protein-tyrosine-phosphatase n=1 Tax=Holothuria leucospilota TaxID=206669 RepID=A0A9Q1C6F7_HOLLE|nr:Receptor-type tyrosine-protein phosphatase T [Holothuria leucospilota]
MRGKMVCKFYILVMSMAFSFFWCYGQVTEQVRMTMLSLNHFKSEQNNHFQCRLSFPDNDPNSITVESLRIGWTRNTAAENQDPPPVVYTTGSRRYHKVNMINNGNDDAFGVFGCKATKDGRKETIVSTTRMRSDADIVPSNTLFTQTVSVGDTNVNISMINVTDDVPVESFRWRHNTTLWNGSMPGIDPNFGVNTFTIDEPIEMHHAGIYECHREGDRALAKHGLHLLIVRACPDATWGPPDCLGVCDSCYNGGVCDENTGKCVCPPGFRGENCSDACDGNRFGFDCEQRCTYRGDPKHQCSGILFCLVHPFGCRCNTGFKGLKCDEECDENTFGASCLQSCHCSSDECNQYTGACNGIDTSCDPGWTGDFCQECEDGYFGQTCDQECHCSPDKCNRESGLCQSGGCLPEWADLFPPYSCQTGLVSATSTRVNALFPVPVNCTAIIGPGGDLTTVDFVLSRHPNNLDPGKIGSSGSYLAGHTVTKLFKVDGVNQNLTLYCQLRTSTDGRVAVLTVNVGVYDLPQLLTAPLESSTNDTSVTITWLAWEEGKDVGDSPVIGYFPYYKGTGDWTKGGDGSLVENLKFIFNNLESDTDYLFGVAAVREGEGGEGLRGPSLQVTTHCAAPTDGPQNVDANFAGNKQQLVELSWEHPSSDDIGCRSGVVKFYIYYSTTSASSNDERFKEVNNPAATSYIIDNLDIGEEYFFEMTLTTEGGESSRSKRIQYLVPVLPELSLSPNITETSSTTISIAWEAWNETRNNGTPPVISYTLYYKLSQHNNWEEAGTYDHIDGQNKYYARVDNLHPDTLYDFSVAAVRIGAGGEGPMSPTLAKRKTKCDVPNVSPTKVTATYTGDDQQLANVTWQMHQDTELACSTGVDYYTIYTFRQGLEIIHGVEDPDARWSLVEGLPPGETYNFKVTLTTSGGESQLNDTNNGANLLLPELPRLSASPYLINRNSTTIRIGWAAWDEALNTGTPPVVSYNLYHKLSSDLEWQNGGYYDVIEGQDEYNATVKDLNPDTLYHISVAAVREGPEGEGKRGPLYEERTVCDVPLDGPQDLVTNVAEKREIVEISWKLPSDDRIRCSNGVLQFNIYYSSTSLTSKEEIKLLVTDSSVRSYKVVNLEVGEEYIFEMTLITEGGESSRSEYVQHLVPGRNVGAIVGSTMASSLFLVLVIVMVVLWLRRDRIKRGKNRKEEPTEGTINNAYSIESLESPTTSKTLPEDEDEAVYANVERPAPILLDDLENYIKTTALEQQFLMFKNESQFLSDVGAKEENKRKNRFKNMIAYDHSRVVLPEQDEDPNSDYYNANYIKNLKGDIGFIASQGPNKASVEDFWRMVWMEKVVNIVMLTNLVEQGKDRCIRYWPNSVGETTVFGAVKVKWQSSYQYANFDVRDYEIIIEKKTHRVRNWHFKTWPDKDIPDQPSPLIEFARRVKTQQKDETVPLIVHCSAGVGRTGTFIALYSLMDAVETSEKLDVYGFVEQMREDRINMVQTPRQYKFLHECLFEVYLTGDTAIPINKLTTFDVKNQGEKLCREFQLLAKFNQMSRNAPSDVTNESEKSRFSDLLPVEKKRPYLQSPAKNSSSNYINACSVKSYRKESSFIATQSPLPSTVEDFWRLVFDWKCPLIVMLNQLDENDRTVCKYWPDTGSSQYGHITVDLKEEQKDNQYISRLFEVDHAHMKKPILVQHLQLTSWDENNLWDIYSFIKEMEKLQDDFKMVEPTVVHCINGVGRTGVIIAVISEMERIEAEEKVDVFTTVRQMRASNHNLIQTEEEYTLCYQLLNLSSPEATYANI